MNIKKKIVSLALTALLVISNVSSVSATEIGKFPVPDFSALIGNKLYTLSYANDNDNKEEIRTAIVNSKSEIYIKTTGNSWLNNSTGKPVSSETVNKLNFEYFNGGKMGSDIFEGSIRVHYLEQSTNKELLPSKEYSGKVGSLIEIKAEEIVGYTVLEETIVNPVITVGVQDVTFIYGKSAVLEASVLNSNTLSLKFNIPIDKLENNNVFINTLASKKIIKISPTEYTVTAQDELLTLNTCDILVTKVKSNGVGLSDIVKTIQVKSNTPPTLEWEGIRDGGVVSQYSKESYIISATDAETKDVKVYVKIDDKEEVVYTNLVSLVLDTTVVGSHKISVRCSDEATLEQKSVSRTYTVVADSKFPDPNTLPKINISGLRPVYNINAKSNVVINSSLNGSIIECMLTVNIDNGNKVYSLNTSDLTLDTSSLGTHKIEVSASTKEGLNTELNTFTYLVVDNGPEIIVTTSAFEGMSITSEESIQLEILFGGDNLTVEFYEDGVQFASTSDGTLDVRKTISIGLTQTKLGAHNFEIRAKDSQGREKKYILNYNLIEK